MAQPPQGGGNHAAILARRVCAIHNQRVPALQGLAKPRIKRLELLPGQTDSAWDVSKAVKNLRSRVEEDSFCTPHHGPQAREIDRVSAGCGDIAGGAEPCNTGLKALA